MAKENIKEKQKSTEINLIEDSKLTPEKLFEKYRTTREGVSVVDIDDRLNEYGRNVIEMKDNNTFLHKLKEAFINPFNIVLMIVAAFTFVTDVIISEEKSYATFILIISTILISAIISLNQQTKSDNAAKKLKKMITNKLQVIRENFHRVI